MSRRLAEDKRPHGQMLQSLERGEPGGARERARNSRRPDDADASFGRSFASPTRSPHHPQHSPHPDRRTLQKNVFIDSYYPVVQGDYSEPSRCTHSSYEHIDALDFSTTDGHKSEDSSDSDSRRTPTTPTTNLPQHNATIPSRSDSKTYTVLSNNSDLDSTSDNTPQGPNTPTDDGRPPSSTFGCFSQLYHRIHNLEDLLQQTLEKSVQPRENKYTETVGEEGDGMKTAKKTPPAGAARAWKSTCPSIPEGTDEKGNSDTDNELRGIKKRLRVLERKLRKTKNPPQLHRNPREPLTSSSLVLTGIGDRCGGRSKNAESTVSETESFLQSELVFLNSPSLEKSDGDSCDRKARTKVRKKFISKCRGIRRKCSGFLTSGKKMSKNAPLIMSTTSEWSEIFYKHAILTEESVGATLLSQSFSTQTKTDSSTVVYVRCQREGLLEPPPKPRKKNGKKRKYLCKKNSKTNILSVQRADSPNGIVIGDCDVPPTTTLQFCDHDRKPRPKDMDQNVWTRDFWKGDAVGDSPPHAPPWDPQDLWMPLQHKCCPPADHQPDHWRHCNCMHQPGGKPSKNRMFFRNPLNLLKRGGKVKIPVLFEEVCKTPDPKEPGHGLSMRFVVVEEDVHPLTPLRRLINRLSQAKPPPKGDQFVFGVSKCHCNNKVGGLSSMSQRNVASWCS